MSNATNDAFDDADINDLFGSEDVAHDEVGLRDLCRMDLVGRREGRYYAKRCPRDTSALRCMVHGCAIHTTTVRA